MKKIILILISLLMIGCSFKDTTNYSEHQGSSESYDELITVVVIIDSCEYIRSAVVGGYTYTHKGNCHFCKERK